jgi:hypothetical protein
MQLLSAGGTTPQTPRLSRRAGAMAKGASVSRPRGATVTSEREASDG